MTKRTYQKKLSNTDIDRRLMMRIFLQASNSEELATVFLKYPELLEEVMDLTFEEAIKALRKAGNLENLEYLIDRHRMLKDARPAMKNLIAQRGKMSEKDFHKSLVVTLDTEIFSTIVRIFLQASTGEEMAAVLAKYPGLFNEKESDPFFESLISNAIKQGENESAELFAKRFQQLKEMRPQLKQSALESELQKAIAQARLKQPASQRYSHTITIRETQQEGPKDEITEKAQADIKLLLTAIQSFLDVTDGKTAYLLFQTYPELLNEEVNPLFETIIAAVKKQGNQGAVRFLTDRHQLLKKLRQDARKIFKKDSFHRER